MATTSSAASVYCVDPLCGGDHQWISKPQEYLGEKVQY